MTTRSPLRPYPLEAGGWKASVTNDGRTLPPAPIHQSQGDNKGGVRGVPGSSGDLPSVWQSLPDIGSRNTPRDGPATRSAIGPQAPRQHNPESSLADAHPAVTSIPPPSRMPTHGTSAGGGHQYQASFTRRNSRGGLGALSPVLGEGAGGGSAHSTSRTLQVKMQGPDVAAALKAFSEEMNALGTPLHLDSLADLVGIAPVGAGGALTAPAQPTSKNCGDEAADVLEEPTASVLHRSLDHIEGRVLCGKVNQMLPRSPLHLGLHVKTPSSVVVQVPPSRHSRHQHRQGGRRPATQHRDANNVLEKEQNLSVTASRDVGVQAAPLPWTRYFFPDKNAASSTTNSFFKHFDIMEVDPLPHDFPGGAVVDPLPSDLHQQWIRLYYSSILNKPAGSLRSWPMVSTTSHAADLERDPPSFHARASNQNPSHSSVPVGFGSKSAFSEENIQLLDASPLQEQLRMELVDFIRYVTRLQPRTPEDLKPLRDLRLGLLHHLCDIIDNSHRKMYDKHKVKEHRMKRALHEEMAAFKASMKETVKDMSLSHENELRVMKLANSTESRIHSAWKEKSTEHTDNLILKLELLEASEIDLKQRVVDLEKKNAELKTQLQSKSLEFDNVHENLKSKMREEISAERRASQRKIRRMSHKSLLDMEGNELQRTLSGSPVSPPIASPHTNLSVEEQLAASAALVAKLQSNANKYFDELRDTQGQLDQMKAAYRKRLKELEERHRAAQAETRDKFQQVLTSAIGSLTLATGSAAAGNAFLGSVQRFNEEQKARNMSDYDRYQETMMLWDLEAENQLERSQSRPKKTSSSRGEFDPAEHRPASELTAANMISSAQATRTGNMMQMKNQLAAMADQLNSTMSDLKGKDAEVENLNNLLQMMQHQMRSAGTALENHVQVEQRILQEKIEKKQSQEEDDRQELLDQRIKLGQMSSQLQTLTHLPKEELGQYDGVLQLAMETAKFVATPADQREAAQAVEASPSHDALPLPTVPETAEQASETPDKPQAPVARSNFITSLQTNKELQTLRELCGYLRNENQALAESMKLVRSYMEEQLSQHAYVELVVACTYAEDRAQHPGEDAFHQLKTWELGTEGLGDVYDDTFLRIFKMRDEATGIVDKLAAKVEALSDTTPVHLVDTAVAHLAAISSHLSSYVEPFNAEKKQQAFPLPRNNKSDAKPSREHLEALWSLRDKPLMESMDVLVLLEESIDAIDESVKQDEEEGARGETSALDASGLMSELMSCISKEQTALERLEPSLESHLRAAQALKRKAANAVADYGRSELEVDSDVLAMEGLRSYACAYTLYMNLAAAQGTAWRRKDGEEVPRLMQLEESLRTEIEDKLAAQALLRETQDELVCLKNVTVMEEQDLEEAMQEEPSDEPDMEFARRSSSSLSMRKSVLSQAGRHSSQSHPLHAPPVNSQRATSGGDGDSDTTPQRSLTHEDESLPGLSHESRDVFPDALSTPLFTNVGRNLHADLAMTAPASMVRFAEDSPMGLNGLNGRMGGDRHPSQRQRLVPAGRSFRHAMSTHNSPKHTSGRLLVGRLASGSPQLSGAKSDDEDVDAPPFDSPDTSTQSPATSQRRWRASTVKVSNLFCAKDASNRKKELSLDMLEGMNYLHKVAKDASTGDARARALLHAQNRVAGLIIGSAALTGGYPSMGLDDEEGATLVRRLGKLMLDGAVDEDATAFQLDQKDAEISRLNAILKQYAHSAAAGPQNSPHPLQRSHTRKSSMSATPASFKVILKHPPEDVDYLAWLFSDENLQRVEGISELKELMLAGLLYMQEEHSTHMYTSTVVSENGPLTKKPVNHNSDFMQLIVVTPGCPLGGVGDYLPQDSTSAPYKAINSQRETSYVDRKTGRKIAIVPILVPAKNNETPAFSWGTIAYTVDARLTDDIAQLALEGRIMVRGLQKAVCKYLGHDDTPGAEATTSGAQKGAKGWQRLASGGGGALTTSHTLSMHDLDDETYKRFMTQKAVIEAMFSQDDKLKNMTVELKRYRIAPLAVAGVSAAVMVLLGDRRMMEMVKKGMPKGGSVAVQNIWVHAQKAFTGGNQRTGKGKWAKAIPGAVKEPDIFERIKEFSFDSLTSDQLSAARLILEQVPEEAVIKASKVIAVLRNWAASVCGIVSLLERGQDVDTTTPVLDIPNNM